ncbi:MAG: eCIS core domain-containing protein [Flavobacteriales bacterium]
MQTHTQTTKKAPLSAARPKKDHLSTVQRRENRTGMPEGLKNGVEQLSGLSMDDVKVHYNSAKPATLQAHAYAQGTDIHLGPGQEKHLPHEAWHVVQQKQDRVRPTAQLKGKTAINDDRGLESEADLMGAKALSAGKVSYGSSLTKVSAGSSSVAQRVGGAKVAFNPDSIAKAEFREAVQKLFDTAREINKLRKKVTTDKNNTALADPVTNKAKQVKDTYGGELAGINLDAAWIAKILTRAGIEAELTKLVTANVIDAAKKTALLVVIDELITKLSISGSNIVDKTWKAEDGGVQPTTPILSGKDAFVKIVDKGDGGIERDVYKKLGKKDGENNQYVLDDFGNHTRRYAYMEKSYHQWMAYKEQGFLTGKTQSLMGAATGVSPDRVDPADFDRQHLTTAERDYRDSVPEGPGKSKKVLAHLHQWKGSGPGQRGLSLTSTAKDEAIYGNQGESFRSDDGAKFKIDLSKVKADNILINHYHAASPTRAGLGTKGARPAPQDGRIDGHYQYERSVIKNRELYLQTLTPEAVVGIELHNAGMDIDRDSAIFKAQKAKALANGPIEQDIEKQEAIVSTQQAKVNAATAVVTAKTAEKARITPLKTSAAAKVIQFPSGGKKQWSKEFNKSLDKHDYWVHMQQKYSTQETACTDAITVANAEIAAAQSLITAANTEILRLKATLNAAPDAADGAHAKAGWDAGKATNAGYKDGLAAKARAGARLNKVRELFQAAYADKDKHLPYWEGYGKALNS